MHKPLPIRQVIAHALPVSTVSTQILPPRSGRQALLFTRVTTGAIFVSFGQDASTNAGLGVTSAPVQYPITRELLGSAIEQAVYAVGTASATLSVLEIIGECPCEARERTGGS